MGRGRRIRYPGAFFHCINRGNRRRLTFSSRAENSSWSRAGRWIYFNDLESVKKVPSDGGPVVLVTKNLPGYAPVESLAGKFIYVTWIGIDASDFGEWRFRGL
jgi:hypothetical protein